MPGAWFQLEKLIGFPMKLHPTAPVRVSRIMSSGQLDYSWNKPIITRVDPKLGEALTAVETYVNGNLNVTPGNAEGSATDHAGKSDTEAGMSDGVKIRRFKLSDHSRLLAIHRAQGFDYAFPAPSRILRGRR